MKWVSNHNRVHDNRDGWCRKCHSRFHADDIAERHNADCDAYEARIRKLKRIIKALSPPPPSCAPGGYEDEWIAWDEAMARYKAIAEGRES